MQGDASTGHIDFTRPAERHRELRLGDLLNPAMQTEGRPTGEIGQIGIRCSRDQRARLGRSRADHP